MKELDSDILIVGGGLTGLMAAYALSSLKRNIVIIDKFDLGKIKNDNTDLRTTAIAEGSKKFFEKINIWGKLSKYTEPIKRIKVIDREENREINFHNQNKSENLGFIIRNTDLKNVVINSLKKQTNITIVKNISLISLLYSNNFVYAICDKLKIKSKLIIAADGKKSTVRNLLKTPMYKKHYSHSALVVNFHHKKYHNKTAYELFFKSGPLAILPMKKIQINFFSSSVIWTTDNGYAKHLIKINPGLLRLVLEEKIFKYVGEINKIVDVQNYDLSAHINSKFYEDRLIYVSDSAHSIHPIAGQGWNLGVRDIQNCLKAIKDGIDLGLDIGDSYVCKKYHDQSYADTYILYQITDKFNSIFLNDTFVVNKIRQAGFNLIENNKIIKNNITDFAMGI